MSQRQESFASRPPPARYHSSRASRAEPHRHRTSRSTRMDPPRKPPARASTTPAAIPTTTNNNNTRNHSSRTVPRRPTKGLHRENTLQTRYMEMLLSLDKIPRLHNILASFFGWLLLAGFVVFPGTFTSLQQLSTDVVGSAAANVILDHVQNLPLVIIASVACGLAVLGLLWLCVRWRHNYVWLLNRIYLPGATNSLAGLISSLVTVYTQRDGDWSIMAKVTAGVEAGALVVCGVLFVVNTLMLKRIKWRHDKEMDRWDQEQQHHRHHPGDEGLLEKAGRKLKQPAVEPQSVV